MAMKRKSRTPKQSPTRRTKPFQSAEEAWFWYIRCQKARNDGARMEADMSRDARPCDPDDLYRAVKQLSDNRRISRNHVNTLVRYGESESPPDPRCREEEHPHRLWSEALDKLSIILKQKNIIEQ
jgi:hypothetical protein